MIQDASNRMVDAPKNRRTPKGAQEAIHVLPLGFVPPHKCHVCGRGQSVTVKHRRHAYCEVQGRECGHRWLYFPADAHQKAHTAPITAFRNVPAR